MMCPAHMTTIIVKVAAPFYTSKVKQNVGAGLHATSQCSIESVPIYLAKMSTASCLTDELLHTSTNVLGTLVIHAICHPEQRVKYVTLVVTSHHKPSN